MASMILGAAFSLILALSIVLNAFFLVAHCRRHRLKSTGFYTLHSALAFVDVMAAGIWTGISAAAATFDWEPKGEVCHLQSYFFTFTQIMTAFILATVALERLLRMVKPSRHKMVFVPKVTAFLIFALCVFCGVVSSIHLYGTLDTTWHGTEKHCRPDFTQSVKMLRMTFCFDYAIPYWVIALPAFIGAFVKYFMARKKLSPYGEIVLEKNSYAPSDSYSSRLSKMQARFGVKKEKVKQKTKANSKKPTLGKRMYTRQGYTEMEHWDSDINDGDNSAAADADVKLRTHALPRPEYKMLMTSALVTMVTSLLWFPWIVTRFVLSYTPRDPTPDWMVTIAVLCAHSAAFIKPILYFSLNPFFRSAFKKTFGCCRKKGKPLLDPKEKLEEPKNNLAYEE